MRTIRTLLGSWLVRLGVWIAPRPDVSRVWPRSPYTDDWECSTRTTGTGPTIVDWIRHRDRNLHGR